MLFTWALYEALQLVSTHQEVQISSWDNGSSWVSWVTAAWGQLSWFSC